MVENGLECFILKFIEPLQSCCCAVPKNLPIKAELAWQVSMYLWRGSVNWILKWIPGHFSPSFLIFKAKNFIFKTWEFSPLIEWVIAGVLYVFSSIYLYVNMNYNRWCTSDKSYCDRKVTCFAMSISIVLYYQLPTTTT